MLNEVLKDVHVDVLIELVQQDSNVIALEADLMGSIGTQKLQEKFPENLIECGIAEANMVGVASGLSSVGKIPFIHSFGCFVTRRCFDQLFLSGGYAKQHINIWGSDPGVAAVTNGGTHMPFEDIGLMRLIPNAIVVDASDGYVMEKALRHFYKTPGINYVRGVRKEAPTLYSHTDQIEIGKANILRDGHDITLLACGLSVHDALAAADKLEQKHNMSVAVIDMHTIKPIDAETIITYAHQTGIVITIENHNVIGGLGDTVANVLIENNLPQLKFKKLGIHEQFGQVGDIEFLKNQYQISIDAIINTCLSI